MGGSLTSRYKTLDNHFLNSIELITNYRKTMSVNRKERPMRRCSPKNNFEIKIPPIQLNACSVPTAVIAPPGRPPETPLSALTDYRHLAGAEGSVRDARRPRPRAHRALPHARPPRPLPLPPRAPPQPHVRDADRARHRLRRRPVRERPPPAARRAHVRRPPPRPHDRVRLPASVGRRQLRGGRRDARRLAWLRAHPAGRARARGGASARRRCGADGVGDVEALQDLPGAEAAARAPLLDVRRVRAEDVPPLSGGCAMRRTEELRVVLPLHHGRVRGVRLSGGDVPVAAEDGGAPAELQHGGRCVSDDADCAGGRGGGGGAVSLAYVPAADGADDDRVLRELGGAAQGGRAAVVDEMGRAF